MNNTESTTELTHGLRDELAPSLIEQLLEIARASALEEMASGIAHELNQPLGAIVTFSEAADRMLTRPEPMVAEARDVARHIGDQAIKASEGIKRIRQIFTHSDTPRSLCNMTSVVTELWPVMELLATRDAMELQIQTAENLPKVMIDQIRIQHTLFSLVRNAIEASKASTLKPVIQIEISGDRYNVVTTVTDYASGISSEMRQKMFRPFFTTKANGTGLGLASSRAIVEAHGGSLEHADGKSGGSRFWFRLPAAS
ncbi:MAG: sensor histidine kinase [Steroidobacteraceae bacterium]